MLIEPGASNRTANYSSKTPRIGQNRQQTRETPDNSPITRPDDLGIRSWYNEQFSGTVDSPSSSIGGICDRSSYPSSSSSSFPHPQSKALSTFARANSSLYAMSANKERESSIESNDVPGHRVPVPRKAYMDLSDAIALLDETCPNQEISPSLTPRTPRTPLTPFPRSKRVRSKSSDNSSNYSNDLDRLNDGTKNHEKSQETKRRPFLRKIGVSKTEDRPLLAKIIAPKIIGKPYLEKIGPSRAVEKPFLEKIGSSKTLDRFTFDALRELPRAISKKCQPVEPSPLTIEPVISRPSERTECLEEDADDEDDVLCIIKDERDDEEEGNDLEDDTDEKKQEEEEQANLSRVGTTRRRSNGKGYLLKMYSFETEDLAESAEVTSMKAHRDPLRGASLDDVLDSGPSSFPPSEDSHEHPSSRSDERSTSVAELVKCRVTTSEEIVSARQGSPREVTSWGNSPRWLSKRRSRRVVSASRTRAEDISRIAPSDESTPNSPTKRRASPEADTRSVVFKTKSSGLPRDSTGSPLKTRRQASNEEATSSDSRRELESKSSRPSSEERYESKDESKVSFARCKSRRQTFKEAMEKFGGTVDYSGTKRQVSEEILDRNRKNGESPRFAESEARLERRGISSDNLKLSRETMVASVPSTSSLGYQSGDSSLVSQRSSYHSQDFIRGPLKILYDKFEHQELPSESYAAFKMRTRANHQLHHPYHYKEQRKEPESRDEKIEKNVEDKTETETTNPGTEYDSNSRNPTRSASEEIPSKSSSITTKSVLRKQDGVDQSDHETESVTNRHKRRITNEPSQETMDLLKELRRVKSMLRTPSIETQDDYFKPPPRLPKKILLTDKEFCLSVERENSVRRRPSTIRDDIQDKMEDSRLKSQDEDRKAPASSPEKVKPRTGSRRQRAIGGPALFEKRCLSLDYADEEKPPKPEARAISLVASSRTPRSGTGDYEHLDSSDPAGLGYDARSYSSDVFTSPSDENEEPQNEKVMDAKTEDTPMNNHCAEVDIAIPVDHVGLISPKRRIHPQGRTSDFYEIISPRSTPFRVKKRLGRISVEDSVKQESFTLQSKVDCRAIVTQKRTKCFPL